ncbi:MAG: S8 family serine peptidase, partial [Oscillospiraceae bacterium]|nr:S8 family serine peptidase [Oscillospiraceae bacterium]
EPEDYYGLDVEEKIVLVSRGKISFSDKAYNAADAGAVGLIVYDNDENGELLTMECYGLPSGFISLNAGMQMIEEKNKTVTFSQTPQLVLKYDKEVMSSFSSWDFTESLLLKPDITGFGGNIISSVPDINQKVHNLYAPMSGTSMSSPQIAGLNAILKQYLKENTDKYGIADNTEYRELMAKLLMSTAKPISTNDGLEVASPRVQGNGLANVADAINTSCYLSSNSAVDNYRPKISLGENSSGEYVLQFNIHNVSDSAQTYQLSADVFSDTMNDDSTLSWNTQRLLKDTDYILIFEDSDTGSTVNEITVEPISVKPVTAKIILTQEAYSKIFDTFENGTFIDGFINLRNETSPSLTLSFMTFCGSWKENDQSDLIEQFIYKDTDNEYGSYLSDGVNIAGINIIEAYDYLIDSFNSDSSEPDNFAVTLSQPYFSPKLDTNGNDKAFNNLFLEAYFKRRCYEVKVTIYNSANQEIYSEIVGAGNIRINPFTNERASDSFEIGWDFRDIDGKIHNNENYTIQVSAKTPLSENYSSKVISQSFTIDTEKPIINKCSKLILGNTEYLMIEASDNGTLQGAVSYENYDELIPEDFSPAKASYENSILVRLPENTSESFVEIYDMAGNYETIYVSDVTDNLYLNINDKLEFASDEPTFKNKISFVDDNGNEENISYDFSSTPAEVYENQEEETILIINGIETVLIPVQVGLRGDSNSDKRLTANDAAYIAKMLAHQKKDELPAWSDYNKDGKITAGDAAAIAHYLANKYV